MLRAECQVPCQLPYRGWNYHQEEQGKQIVKSTVGIKSMCHTIFFLMDFCCLFFRLKLVPKHRGRLLGRLRQPGLLVLCLLPRWAPNVLLLDRQWRILIRIMNMTLTIPAALLMKTRTLFAARCWSMCFFLIKSRQHYSFKLVYGIQRSFSAESIRSQYWFSRFSYLMRFVPCGTGFPWQAHLINYPSSHFQLFETH